MGKKEVSTDLWVNELLKEANIKLDPQGSAVKEVDKALSSASKSDTGNVGFPEYCGIVKDFLLVIEDKADVSFHIKRNDKDLICSKTKSKKDYAINGALHYGKHLAKNTSYNKVIAFGVSGNEKKHRITPIFIDERGGYKELADLETFMLFNEKNIEEYYTRNILEEKTPEEKTTEEILKDAKELHEDLRNYGSIQDKDKPLIVSGILLALREMENKSFNIENLVGDQTITDGEKIYEAIERNLKRANVSPQVKKDKLLSQFLVIKDTKAINEVNKQLGKTPIKHYAEFLNENLYKNIKHIHSAEDYLGRFYGEFMSYSGGDGQSLGIVLTPKHITELFCDIVELKSSDKVLDPCCGTGGFLIAAMHDMLQKTDNPEEQRKIRKNQLHGLELQPYMFTISTTNMILRGDGKSNLEQQDFLRFNPSQLQEKGCTVGMMNPPYSMGSKTNPNLYEINFTEHLLNSVVEDGKVVVIVPQSSMVGNTKEEKAIKANILKNHTLEGVITLNKNSFYGVGTNPCLAIFTAGVPHYKDKKVKFINFKNDGFEVQKHLGLIETIEAKDKKQHLLDVYFDRIESESKFCVKTSIESTDEWLHSFYYFNDEIPELKDFEQTIIKYLSFEFSMVVAGKNYLFSQSKPSKTNTSLKFNEQEWGEFVIEDVFDVSKGIYLHSKKIKQGNTPYITAKAENNGCSQLIGNTSLFKGNSITIEKVKLSSFYQPHDFYCSHDVTVISNAKLNKYNALFICAMINRNGVKYNYGRQAQMNVVKREKILLPVNSKNEPDYKYMEGVTKRLEYDKLSNYINEKE